MRPSTAFWILNVVVVPVVLIGGGLYVGIENASVTYTLIFALAAVGVATTGVLLHRLILKNANERMEEEGSDET